MRTLEAIQTRLGRLRELMRQTDLDGILLRKRRHFAWLTGGRSNYIVLTTDLGVADLVVFPDRVVCVTNQMEAARIREEELVDLPCEWITPEWYEGNEAAIASLCQGKRMGADTPAALELPGGVDVSRQVAELSYVLDVEEMARYRTLSQAAARALESVCREIRPGMSEYEIQAQLAARVIAQGMTPHVMLVATDERIFRYRHPIPTSKQLERYAMVVLCAERWGLIANVTRFVHFGPLPAEVRENREKLARIDLAMNLATRPGTLIRDVVRQGIHTYEELGFGDDWRYLHLGGPTGYAPREFLATPTCEGRVQLHQAFAWNPAMRGIKSEDTILVGPDGNEFLTQTGEWPSITVEQDGRTYQRPDVLVYE